MSAKQAHNDKLQGSVAAYLRCGGVVNNQIKKGLLLSLWVKKIKSANIWQRCKQERDCLAHFLRLVAVCWPGAQSAPEGYFPLERVVNIVSRSCAALEYRRYRFFKASSRAHSWYFFYCNRVINMWKFLPAMRPASVNSSTGRNACLELSDLVH